MTKKIMDHVDRETGLTLVELLVSLIVGAMVLSVLVMVSFNVFHVFDTTKSYALTTTDNYSLTTLLHDVAQDATSVSSVPSAQGTSAVQFTMGSSIPPELPTSFKGTTSVTLTWNGTQLLASATGVTPTVVYSSQNNAAFSLKYDAKNLFELVPPTPTSQSIYFHVNTANLISTSFVKNFSGLTLNPASSQMVPGQTYDLSGNLSATGASGSKGIKGVSISVSSSAGGSVITTTNPNGDYSVSYSVPAGASIGSTITFTATGDGATATATATIGTYSIRALGASPSTVNAGGTTSVSGTVLFNQSPVSGASVSFTAQGGGSFSSSTVTTDANGKFTANYTAPMGAASVTITAADPTLGVTGTVAVSVVMPPSMILSATPTPVATGQSVAISVQVLSNGVNISNQTVMLTDNNAGGSFSSVTIDSSGSYTSTYTAPSSASSVTITATDAALNNLTKSIQVSVETPVITIKASPTTVNSGGKVTITGSLTLGGSGLASQPVILSDNAGGSFMPTTVRTDSAGGFSATYVAPKKANAQDIITATALGASQTTTVNVEAPVMTLTATSSQILPGQTTLYLISGQSQGYTVNESDGSGNPVPNATIQLSAGSAGGTFLSSTDGNAITLVTTDAKGNANFTYQAAVKEQGSVTITATDTSSGAIATSTINVGTPVVTVTATPTTVATGGQVTIEGKVTFEGVGVDGQTVTLSDNAGGSFTPTTVTTNDANGDFSATYVAPKTANAQDIITATALGVSQTTTLNVEAPVITIQSLDPTSNTPVTSIDSGKTVNISGTVTLGGQPYQNQTVTLSDQGAGGQFGSSSVTTDVNGKFTTTYTAATPSLPNVEWLGDSSNPTIVINDVGFGSTPPTSIPAYNTDGNYVGVTDTTGNWNMGMTGNWVEEDILAWSDNQIVVQPTSQATDIGGDSKHGHSDHYGDGYGSRNQSWYTQNGWLYNQGDQVQITVQNASGQSIVIPTTVNYQSNNVTGTATITATSDGVSASTNLTVKMGYSLPVTQNTLQISNVSWKFDGNSNPVITITGSGFGTQSNWWMIKKDFDGSLVINDTSGSWEMGNWGDPVIENIQSWSDTQITLRPGWGYGQQGWWWNNGGSTNTFNSGDNYTITLTANGNSTTYTSTVPAHDQTGDNSYSNDQNNGQDGSKDG